MSGFGYLCPYRYAKAEHRKTEVESLTGHKSETEEITGLLQEIKESSNRSSLAASGIGVMGLVLGLTGIAVVLKNVQLLNVALWLTGFATLYNLGILVQFARKSVLRWIERRRKAKQ